jgi:hypothetical protein
VEWIHGRFESDFYEEASKTPNYVTIQRDAWSILLSLLWKDIQVANKHAEASETRMWQGTSIPMSLLPEEIEAERKSSATY